MALLAPVTVATDAYTICKYAVVGGVVSQPDGGVNTFVTKL